MSQRLWLSLIAGVVSAELVCAQVVVGDVAAVGFRASKTAGAQFVVREGQWVPIQVQLSVQGSAPFQGQLRFEAPDLDGDLVAYRERPVTVTYEAGRKRSWCYAVWLPDRAGLRGPGTVDVLSDEGFLINRLNVPYFDVISNDTVLILDISARPVTALRGLQTSDWTPMDDAYGRRPYYRNVLVAAMPASELPDRWFGLEAVDVVVWDEPVPAGVSIAQLAALGQWVENGGQLVVGLGQSWSAVQKSALADILPLRPIAGRAGGLPAERGATLAVERLEQFFEQLAVPSPQRPARERQFRAPIVVAATEAKPQALRSFRERVPGERVIDLIATRWVGSGRVVGLAASLRDLTQVPVEPAFYAQLLDLNPTTAKFRENELGSLQATLPFQPRALYDGLLGPISFAGWSGVLVLAAFAFVVAYIGVATLASWWWLKRHRLTTLNWTVFAVIAVVASALSLGTVGVLRGVSRGVRVVSLVDLEAGGRDARAKCYFGYSSPVRGRFDLSLPGDGGFLRALARGPKGSKSYATPQRYAALAGAALLERTPLRATLKQFEGWWQGELSGSIRAQLSADRESGRVTAGSWIQNDLDVALVGGYLLYVDPRFRGDGLGRPAGHTTNWWGRTPVPPGLNVLAAWVPPLPAGQKVSGLGQGEYEQIARARAAWERQRNRKPETWPDLLTLWDAQQYWVGTRSRMPQRGLDDAARAALLAATRSFYLHCREEKERFDEVNGAPITTDGLMSCDVSHWLMQGRVKATRADENDPLLGQAVLLLLADDPGPASLHRDGKPLRMTGGRTLYRVRVPITFTGAPPQTTPMTGVEP